MLQLLRTREDQQTACLAVQTMYDVDTRARVLSLNVRAQDRESGRLGTARRCRNGQKTRLLVDYDQIVVLIHDLELRMGQLTIAAARRNGHYIALLQGKIMTRLYGVAYFDTTLTKQLLDR